ncbi:MAG: hypothetical protein F6K47_35560 [Symploca sp. SIO2E6]|nr:hypothetical protein [Symploca sp. SIO2E6]
MGIKIKLMPDYGCYPLWWAEGNLIGNIDPATLPLSKETVKRLLDWATTCSQTLNWEDPASGSGFASQEAEEEFEPEGMSLWNQLQEELAEDYEVLYFSDVHLASRI